MLKFSTVQGDCMATYLREKQVIQKLIDGMPGRICLTLDLWHSHHKTGYVFVTGQFIDIDFKIHKKLLNVVMEPYPESDSTFSHAVSVCLSDWNIEGKLFSVTINQPLSEAGINSLRGLLSEKSTKSLDGQLLLTNCFARSLGCIAQEALKAGQETVKKVRDFVKYVKNSESVEEKYLALKQQLQVQSTKTLSLDDQTQWNTTYEMLMAASKLKQVFSLLDIEESKGLTDEDWKIVDNLCMYIKLLFNTANLLTSSTVSTANTFFHEAWMFQLELTRASTMKDLAVSTLTKPMQESFDKYWKSCFLILVTAVVMDPRFKMKLVEFSFSKIYGDEAASYIKIVDEGIHELFLEYAIENTSQQSKSELDQYLEESLLPRIHEFDVMGWWKLNKIKYPTLSKMAHDILIVPVSTVSPGSVFYTGIYEMDHYHCSLKPETVQALFCAKDWMHSEDGVPNLGRRGLIVTIIRLLQNFCRIW